MLLIYDITWTMKGRKMLGGTPEGGPPNIFF